MIAPESNKNNQKVQKKFKTTILQSLLMNPETSSMDCELLSTEANESESREEKKKEWDDAENETGGSKKVKRSAGLPGKTRPGQVNATAPNIDILINPSQKKKREEYVGVVMNKLRDFFKDKNSTLIYPNLFRLLW